MLPILAFAVPFAVATLLPAQDPILARLPADTTHLVVIRDPLPHVNALLGSPLVREVFANSGELQQEVFVRRFDAASLRALIAQFAPFVPTESIVAASAPAKETLLRAAQLGTAIGLLSQMDRNAPAHRELVKDLQSDAEKALAAIERLDLFASVELRDVRTAERWFDDAATLEKQLQGEAGIEVNVAETTLTVRVRPRHVMNGKWIEWLTSLGVRVPETWNPTFVASLAQDERRLVLRIGEPVAGPLDATRVGRLWQGDDAQLFFSRVHLESDVITALVARLAAVQAAGIGAATQIAIRLYGLLSRFADLQDPTTTTIRIGDGVTAVTEMDLGGGVEDLDIPAPAVVKCIDEAAGPFVLSVLPVDSFLPATMDAAEQQLASRTGRFLPKQLAVAREFLDDEDSAVFEPGTLVMWRPAQFRGARDLKLGEMPFAAMALVAVADDATAAADFVSALSEHVCEGFEVEPRWTGQDLGLGVETQVLDLATVAPRFAASQVDCDFVLHWFTVDAVLVVSTDPSVSKQLIARLRSDAGPKLPAGKLLEWTRWSGEHLGATWAGLSRWLQALDPNAKDAASRALRSLDALAPLVAAVDAVERVTTLDGSIVRGVTTLRLRAPK